MKNKKIYYILSVVWGFPMVLIGWVAECVLRCFGYKPNRYGDCKWFSVGKDWGGISLGLVIITDEQASVDVLNHEFGHRIQNSIYGWAFPFVVAIPSVIRYWKREADIKKGKELEPYDAIWFEGQATRLGTKYIKYFNENGGNL